MTPTASTVRFWRTADGTPVGKPITGHRDAVSTLAAGALLDGTPVIISGGGFSEGTVRVWRTTDGPLVGKPLVGKPITYHILLIGTGTVTSVAAGALSDGTPVIISGGGDGTVRVWRTADGVPVGEPLTGHDGPVNTVAAGAPPDGIPVIISGGRDGTVRV